jgi:3-hydroxyacyl-[acyl-carrier-protein] dehydratase
MNIEALIPHRPPFLFVQEIVEMGPDSARTRQVWPAESAFYAGHYPGNPITPGVLLCEAIFQSAAAFMASRDDVEPGKTPVLSRISDARFKRMVKPGDAIEIEVFYKEALKAFHFMRGVARLDGKVCVSVEFALALVD